MTICSLVVQALPEDVSSVSASLESMHGVEVQLTDKSGKLVVTIDHPDRDYCSRAMTDMTKITGVMNTALVYEYQEDLE